ncbi:MAG TPA: response regulator [Blastocatellia bacterium]|nr:response regulator [Blastocatellia bacterium]
MDNNNQTSRGSSKYRLLLVDDDNFTHEMMDLFLRNTEYVLISAFSTDEALRIIVSDAPDIVITDAMMPGESGFSLIDKIKARPASSKIPILLWTMLTQSDGSVMDASGKADIVIGKPIGEDARPTAPLMTR